MAGRPRTMAKRVRQLLERHTKLGDDLYKLMPKQYVPDPAKGEQWDSEFAEAEGSTLACLWRRAIHEFANSHEWLNDLTAYLQVRADEADQNARQTDSKDADLGGDLSTLAGEGPQDEPSETELANVDQVTKITEDAHGKPAKPATTEAAEEPVS